MINYILCAIIAISCVYAFLNGGIDAVSNAAINSGETAVGLLLSIIGAMATWGGVMRVAQSAGLSDKLTKLISPLLKKIFRGLDSDSPALKAIAMNIAANMFGLGNAATPLGIEAMRSLEKEEGVKSIASRNMIILTLFNTSSIELIPTTVATLRLAHGSRSPLEILPCVLLVSIASLTLSIMFADLFEIKGRNKKRKE